MDRRKFLKMLGLGVPAIALAGPSIKELEVIGEPVISAGRPAYCTATEGTLSTVSTTWSKVWVDAGGKVTYYPHPWKAAHKNLVLDKDTGVWSATTW